VKLFIYKFSFGSFLKGQDEDFLDSPDCIRFLMKLMRPSRPPIQKEKLSMVGSRLLALDSIPKPNKVEPSSAGADHGGIVDKVKQLLSITKGWKDGVMTSSDHCASFPAEALSSEWLVLLTLEKACLSTVVLEGVLHIPEIVSTLSSFLTLYIKRGNLQSSKIPLAFSLYPDNLGAIHLLQG
jgi:hypothetical protein